jgi:hypothetical protein
MLTRASLASAGERFEGSRDEFSGADGSIGIEKEPSATGAAY